MNYPGNKVRIHADDFGLTESVNNDILECIDAGIVNSVSLMPNGWGFEHAVNALKERPHVLVSIHLNFLSGPCVANPSEVPLLINEDGLMYNSVLGLCHKYYFASRTTKNALKEQIKKEAEAQINKTIDAFKGQMKEIRLDSERFSHLLPFIFDIFVELDNKFPVEYIRLPREPVREFIDHLQGYHFQSINNIPKFIAAYLSEKIFAYRRQLKQRNIVYPDFIIGIIKSGHMYNAALSSYLEKYGHNKNYEIVFHPGRVRKNEVLDNAMYTYPLSFFTSENRHQEKNLLLSRKISHQ